MEEEIKKVLDVLKNKGTILYPTDTVWGIGCDATNAEAVKKVFEIKKRSDTKSMIILVDSESMLIRYARGIPEVAWELIEYSDKPLTIIYDGAHGLAPNVLSEDGSVGIRICKDEFCQKLIRMFGKPLVSTSANISGEQAPTNFGEISPSILESVDYVVNLRQKEINLPKPSTIIKLNDRGEIKIIRK